MPAVKIVSVDREGNLITTTKEDGEVVKRTLVSEDMVNSLEFDDGTVWKKVEAIYFDPVNSVLKIVYKA